MAKAIQWIKGANRRYLASTRTRPIEFVFKPQDRYCGTRTRWVEDDVIADAMLCEYGFKVYDGPIVGIVSEDVGIDALDWAKFVAWVGDNVPQVVVDRLTGSDINGTDDTPEDEGGEGDEDAEEDVQGEEETVVDDGDGEAEIDTEAVLTAEVNAAQVYSEAERKGYATEEVDAVVAGMFDKDILNLTDAEFAKAFNKFKYGPRKG